MIFPNDYFFKPPEFYFKTKIFHPNISENGLISMDTLQDEWSPVLAPFNKVILSVQSLLDDPNPNDFLNPKAANLYKNDIKKYEEMVREYTSKFANLSIFKTKLKKFDFEIKILK